MGMADINCNINNQPHEMVSNDKAFLFTLRHLKAQFPRFNNEDTTYFFNRNGRLEIMYVFGNKCLKFENMDEKSVTELREVPGFNCEYYTANKMLIINRIHKIRGRSSLYVYWTDTKNAYILQDPNDPSAYGYKYIRIDVAGAPSEYFEAFYAWLSKHVPTVDIATKTVTIFN